MLMLMLMNDVSLSSMQHVASAIWKRTAAQGGCHMTEVTWQQQGLWHAGRYHP